MNYVAHISAFQTVVSYLKCMSVAESHKEVSLHVERDQLLNCNITSVCVCVCVCACACARARACVCACVRVC